MRKNILIHSIVFSPDGDSTAYIYNDIALKLKDHGYNVVVLTTTPHYNIIESELKKQPLSKKLFGLFYTSNYNGINVKHIYQKKYQSTIFRIFCFLYWHICSFILAVYEKKVDIILSPSPPLTIGLLNIIIGKIKGAKIIYNVQEIYPDLLIEEGGVKSRTIIYILKWLERYVYNKSHAVITIDTIFYNTIINRIEDSRKLHIIPNFVDTNIYKPIDRNVLEIDKELFPDTDSLRLMYAGNIGHAQDWKPLIKLAELLKNDPVDFFIIGDGVKKDYLLHEKEEKNLNNIHFVTYQPRALIPSLIAYSDLQFIFMAPHTEDHGFPSKVYTIMACAKPLLVCSGENSSIVNFLKNKDCAYIVTEKNIEIKVKKLSSILKSITKESLAMKGQKGFKHIEMNYSKEVVLKKYAKLIDQL